MPRYCLWGCSRLISRSSGTFFNWRKAAWYKFFVFGGLCWSRILQHRNSESAGGFESALERQNHDTERQPRVQVDHAGLWLLRRVSKEVWECKHLEKFHGFVWLSSSDSSDRRVNILPPWRAQSFDWQLGPYKAARQSPRSPARRARLWSSVVGPWWPRWVEYQSAGSRLHIWKGYFGLIQSDEQLDYDRQSPLACHGGL